MLGGVCGPTTNCGRRWSFPWSGQRICSAAIERVCLLSEQHTVILYLSFGRCFSLDIFWTMASLRAFRLRTISNLRKKPNQTCYFERVTSRTLPWGRGPSWLTVPSGPLHMLHQILNLTEAHFGKEKFGHFNIPVLVLWGAPTVQCCRVCGRCDNVASCTAPRSGSAVIPVTRWACWYTHAAAYPAAAVFDSWL